RRRIQEQPGDDKISSHDRYTRLWQKLWKRRLLAALHACAIVTIRAPGISVSSAAIVQSITGVSLGTASEIDIDSLTCQRHVIGSDAALRFAQSTLLRLTSGVFAPREPAWPRMKAC